ncbi:hypothetical protein LguiB_011720 [Lonicera macranthoides]
MASSKMVPRLSTRIQTLLLKLNNKKTSSSSSSSSISPNNTSSIFNSTFPSQASASSTRNCISRLPVELSGLLTMMPLHSAIASARLQSNLSIESQSWGLIPQVDISRFGSNEVLKNKPLSHSEVSEE